MLYQPSASGGPQGRKEQVEAAVELGHGVQQKENNATCCRLGGSLLGVFVSRGVPGSTGTMICTLLHWKEDLAEGIIHCIDLFRCKQLKALLSVVLTLATYRQLECCDLPATLLQGKNKMLCVTALSRGLQHCDKIPSKALGYSWQTNLYLQELCQHVVLTDLLWLQNCLTTGLSYQRSLPR